MEIRVILAGNKRVIGEFEGLQVITDQPKDAGGFGEHPAPFDLFLASIATCAGFFVQSFCETRKLSSEGIKIIQTSQRDEKTHLVSKINIALELPASFPEKYRASVVAAVNQCTVKKHLQNPPQIEVLVK